MKLKKQNWRQRKLHEDTKIKLPAQFVLDNLFILSFFYYKSLKGSVSGQMAFIYYLKRTFLIKLFKNIIKQLQWVWIYEESLLRLRGI